MPILILMTRNPKGVNRSFWEEAFVQGDRALAIEPEVMQDGGGVITGIETNVM
eukprot:COSAG01_NODE_24422_length_779_cov_1.501471_2_plen_52_part_01